MEPCLIGLLSKSSCQETWYARKPGFMLLSSLSETELELLAFRSQTKLLTESISSKHICLHHHAYYLKKFSSHVSSKCCNLFGNHNQKSRKGCREITLELAKALAPTFPDIIPGKKMCISCWITAKSKSTEIVSSSKQSASTASDWESASSNIAQEKVNTVLQLFGESPVAMLSKALHQRQPLVKCKLSSVA